MEKNGTWLNLHNLSIKGKLIWMQVVTCILVLGLCFAAFVITDINGYKERKVKSTTSVAQVIGSNSISAIQFLDSEAAAKTISNVEPDVMNASILDKKGNVFASYTKKNDKPYKFEPPFTNRYQFTDSFLYVYTSIEKNDETFGTVCMQVSLSELETIKKQNFTIAAVLLIIGIGFAFLISIINQRYISRPLLSLVNLMKEVRESDDYSSHVKVTGRDEIAKLSLEFNNLMDQVTQSHQKKDEFIGIASHELKTPLTSVKGYLELLHATETEPSKKTFIQKALNSANKLQSLIYDLLDVSKIQSGQLQLDIKVFDIDELINESINEVQAGVTSHAIIKQSGLEGQLILADRNRIEQVIINILSNAVKYSPKAKEILVNAQKKGNAVIVSIKDFGIGLPESEHQKIFDRFYRSIEEKSGATGFGLGLYICSQIIKRHNGKIWVESEEGQGSTFYFELPANDEL